MKGKIADSVIIKVGHGIMEIPRNIDQQDDSTVSNNKQKLKRQKRNHQELSQR